MPSRSIILMTAMCSQTVEVVKHNYVRDVVTAYVMVWNVIIATL